MLEIIRPVFPEGKLHYVRSYISIMVDGYVYVSFRKRSEDKSKIGIWLSELNFKLASELLDSAEIAFDNMTYNLHGQMIYFTADSKTIKIHEETMVRLARLMKESWEK